MRKLLVRVLILSCLGCALGCPAKTTPARPSVPGSQSSTARESDTAAAAPAEFQPTSTEALAPPPTEPPPSPSSTAERAASAPPLPERSAPEQSESAPLQADVAPGTWTTQRIALLADAGPRLLELRVDVAGVDLATGLAAATKDLGRELGIDWSSPLTWEALLELPLVKSGWMGNLVPAADQRAQLLSLYDSDGNGTVAEAEFRAFVTRGLSRNQHLRLVSSRESPPLPGSKTPFGPLDEDADAELSEREIQNVAAALVRFDFDGDRIVTQAEVQSASESMPGGQMMRVQPLLEATKVVAVNPQKPESFLKPIMESYTFGESIAREAFSAWSQQRFDALDADDDAQITRRELELLVEQEPDAELRFSFPDSSRDESLPARVLPANRTTASAWTANADGGRLNLPGCILIVRLRDDHGPSERAQVEQLLRRALSDAQIAAMFTARLELKEGAFDLLREGRENAEAVAWRWITAPRNWHLTATSSVAESPWFELIDADGDERIVESEMSRFPATALAWDRDANNSLAPAELPTVIRLIMAREDRRSGFSVPGGRVAEKRGVNALPAPAWFSGMDYNSDGEITRAEFLGEEADFSALDANGNGSIEVREVYAPH